ncbi:MAG: cytochrome b/b6 domain-containing protein [Burkholderiales bacterium]|nr:cytochrome b/b6 domain-containing protein [Burkholderiales bacterium]
MTTALPTSPAIATPAPAASTGRIQVWDLPVRVFHWSLLAAVATAIVSGELGGDWMPLHEKAGLAILGLVAFRATWGFVGSHYARFAQFFPTPARLRRYLRGQWHDGGHNPLGALSVLALLGVLAGQAILGLFGNDDIAFSGPLHTLVADDVSLRLTAVHRWLAYGLFGLVGLHIAAILFYLLVRRRNLVRPMVSGWAEHEVPQPARKGGWVALLLSTSVAAMTVFLASGAALHHPPPVKPAVASPSW